MKRAYIGFTIEQFKGIKPSVLIGLTRLIGVEFVEVTHKVFNDLSRVAKNLKGMQTGFHLPLVSDDGWDFSCIEHREKIDTLITQINNNIDTLHISYCLAHPPEPHLAKMPMRMSSDFLISNLKKLNTPVLIENVVGIPFEDFLVLYKQAKDVLADQLVGLCLDAAHCYLQECDPVTQLDKLDGFISCVHLSDCMPGDDTHLAFDLGGVLPIKEIIAKLRKNNYQGYVTLEILPRSFEDIKPAVKSYLKVLKALRPIKYFSTLIRLLFVKPLINRFSDTK